MALPAWDKAGAADRNPWRGAGRQIDRDAFLLQKLQSPTLTPGQP
ncbi:MAG: hypothetical protein M0009_08435 [Deltaproteobacteria bacterium]|nr:hypothetical protein [Deltaproteobacteria bacterium]